MEEEIKGQPPSYPATLPHSQTWSKKERKYTGIEKDKGPEAKDRWDNLSLKKLVKNKPL